VHALIDELQRCDMLHIPYLVLHPGTIKKDDEQTSLKFIAEQINVALQQAKPHHVTLLLETMAGQGSMAGSTFEQLASIIKHVTNKKHIGVCVDTCHIFASGYIFNTPASYKKLWHYFDEIIGLEKLKAFHINDSKREAGSRVDRHEHIGKGKIPKEAFKLLMNDSKFKDVAKILETPKDHEDLREDINNLETLHKLIKK
jgi:deoxyribonuclease-4